MLSDQQLVGVESTNQIDPPSKWSNEGLRFSSSSTARQVSIEKLRLCIARPTARRLDNSDRRTGG